MDSEALFRIIVALGTLVNLILQKDFFSAILMIVMFLIAIMCQFTFFINFTLSCNFLQLFVKI